MPVVELWRLLAIGDAGIDSTAGNRHPANREKPFWLVAGGFIAVAHSVATIADRAECGLFFGPRRGHRCQPAAGETNRGRAEPLLRQPGNDQAKS